MFKIPAVNTFNNWSMVEKEIWINYETSTMPLEPYTGGFLIYEERDCFIEYKRDDKANICEAEAIPMKEGMQKLLMFAMVNNAMSNKN